MEKNVFEVADPIADEIAEATKTLLESPATESLRALLARLNQAIGTRFAVSLELQVEVFDPQKKCNLPLLQTGMSGFDGGKPYQTWDDCLPQHYLVRGEMLVVPHDRCPRCWEVWEFKFKNHSCSHCGVTMGAEVKLLLDTDVCPWCGKGKVSLSEPVCDNCNYEVDPQMVVWG